jgi:hypothetical protein
MSWETLLLHATQPFVEFLQVRQKPHLGATVGFVHKIFERAALSHVSRDVAQDHEEPSVRHEFLNAVTRKTCLESDLRQIIRLFPRDAQRVTSKFEREEHTI